MPFWKHGIHLGLIYTRILKPWLKQNPKVSHLLDEIRNKAMTHGTIIFVLGVNKIWLVNEKTPNC